jgi:signal transduction histidine kinase
MIKKYLLFTVFVSIFFMTCSSNNNAIPAAIKGEIDLSGWDLNKMEKIRLSGMWEFYWDKQYFPEDFRDPDFVKSNSADYVKVPGDWNSYKIKQGITSWNGYATYRLKINLGKTYNNLAIRFEGINMAYSVWINGKNMMQCGVFGRNKNEMVPLRLPKQLYFHSDDKELEIILYVSNFNHDRGGIRKSIILGTTDKIAERSTYLMNMDFFMIGALFVMGIYYLGIYLLGRRNKYIVFFSLVCFSLLLRNLCVNEKIIFHLIPSLQWELVFRIEIISGYLGAIFLWNFFYYLLPDEFNYKIHKVYMTLLGIAIILSCVLPTYLISYVCNITQMLSFFTSSYIFFVLLLTLRKRKPGSFFMLLGFTIFFIITIFDSLASQYFIDIPYISSSGLLFFILTEFAINKRFIESEVNLKKIEERQNALIHAIPDSLLLIKENDIIEFFKTVTNFYLSGETDINDRNIKNVLPPEILKIYLEHKNEIYEHIDEKYVFSKEIEIDGHDNFYEIIMIRTGFSHILMIIRDITLRKKAEKDSKINQERLIQADKLISLGTLVAGVAHEINNPNNSILLSAETLKEIWEKIDMLMEKGFSDYEEIRIGSFGLKELGRNVKESFTRMIHSSRRIKNIIEELKNFSRKNNDEYDDVINIDQLIASSLMLIQNYINSKTDNFIVNPGMNIPDIRGNFQKMEQVLINIIQNACNSLSDKDKKIIVSTRYDAAEKEVYILVEDEGCGMDEKTVKQIFDPFFTTRRDKGGSGLGLSVSAKIIEDHRGKIEIETTPGKGSIFKIILQP